MADLKQSEPKGEKHKPYVPANISMTEFTIKAVLYGLVMSVVLGAANAYLGLKAGMTIAATYPAAVLSMALLRISLPALGLKKGSILEENIARTVGSIGESVAAGAIFTIPAFIISGVWDDLEGHYFQATGIMIVGSLMGILFVTLLRRVMVEDKDLPYPESVAAGEIHKAGRSGGTGAVYLLLAAGVGALIQSLKQLAVFASTWEKFIPFKRAGVMLGRSGDTLPGSGGIVLSSPGVSPSFLGVGYIIGLRLASLNFSGGLLAWGLFVPLLLYFLGPTINLQATGGDTEASWLAQATIIWRYVVRPIAIGGMLMSAAFTLWRMRKNLIGGIKRSIGDVKKAASESAAVDRVDQDFNLKGVLLGIIAASAATFALYHYFAGNMVTALVATIVMVIAGFFFAAVSGYLVGMIGSSNNPISGLTLSTVIIAALLMVALGQTGRTGVIAVLAVAGVICVSAAVAGEMLQDLKVGHILGGTPWKMQLGDIIGTVVASAVMFFPILILHQGDINSGGTGLGGRNLAAPQASLMALVSQGIVGGQMAWPLIIVGILMAIAFILVQVKSPMLVCVGMYLPLDTTFAIFIGGVIRSIVDKMADKQQLNAAQKVRVENNGVLLAAGLIAGEALVGLVFAALAFWEVKVFQMFEQPSFAGSLLVFAVVGFILVGIPLKNAGSPDEPAPPSAMT